jgi:hypothetical protein
MIADIARKDVKATGFELIDIYNFQQNSEISSESG